MEKILENKTKKVEWKYWFPLYGCVITLIDEFKGKNPIFNPDINISTKILYLGRLIYHGFVSVSPIIYGINKGLGKILN